MCGCFAVLIGAFAPRIGLALLWLFTNIVTRPFESFVVPLLGLIFLPYTTLIYVLVWSPVTGVTGLGWLLVILGFLSDIGSYASGAASRRDRRRREQVERT